MHPILERRSRLLLYLAGWAIMGSLLAGVLMLATGRTFGETELFVGPITILYSNVCLSAWWVCRAAPIDRTPLSRMLVTLGGTAVASSVLWTVIASVWSAMLERFGWAEVDVDLRIKQITILLIAGAPLYLLSVVIHYLLIAFERARAAERTALEAVVAGREAELRALRAQLHPHFLFNSLNSINALVGQDPEGARRMCQTLGDFLRGTLNLANRERVPLSEELSLVERYLSIERVRFGERLAVEWAIEPGTEHCLVPPLLMQPLVENAIKHGVSDRIEGGTIRMEARRMAGDLKLVIENPVDDEPTARPGERVGLDNVKRRLAALGAESTRLEVQTEPGVFRVLLTLPADVPDVPETAAAAARLTAAAAPVRPTEERHAW